MLGEVKKRMIKDGIILKERAMTVQIGFKKDKIKYNFGFVVMNE